MNEKQPVDACIPFQPELSPEDVAALLALLGTALL